MHPVGGDARRAAIAAVDDHLHTWQGTGDAAAGAIGLETLLGAALRLHHNGDLPLMRIIEALSTAPARIFGLEGGTLKPGAPADLTILDLDMPWVVREEDICSRSKNTCFEGARLQGKVLQTLVAGRTVFAIPQRD